MIDTITEKIARSAGNRISRRSFIGQVGTSLAVAGAGKWAAVLPQSFAMEDIALACCGCPNCGFSTSCGTSSTCPSGTCGCGAWFLCECNGNSRERRYLDCCAACSGGCSCGADGKPSCLYTAPYGSCSGHTKVKCRVVSCTQALC